MTWWPEARDELARLWVEDTSRQQIAEAADEIDRVLAVDPEARGEPGPEGFRRLTIRPLTVQFAVEEPDRMVIVVTVRLLTD
ncbi:MAG: type II toxin-antitoxin system RelE/ParE family toxin [Pirellulales bacterium]|nr:type II toxin-antitoxin system RelE/ParE family toxin [Pirellulales bacterium]